MELSNKNIAIIIAHPDDEVIGCGGFINNAVLKGAHCRVILSLKRSNQRNNYTWENELNQFKLSCEILGAEPFVSNELVSDNMAMSKIKEISSSISEHINWADIVLCHWKGDTHQAHQAISYAVELLTRPFRNPKTVLCFEVATSTDQGFENSFSPNCFIALSETEVQNKKLAMQQYENEFAIGRTPDDLKTQMKFRGNQSGTKYAEAFFIARHFIK